MDELPVCMLIISSKAPKILSFSAITQALAMLQIACRLSGFPRIAFDKEMYRIRSALDNLPNTLLCFVS